MTNVIAATPIGYTRANNALPVAAVIATAMNGNQPPNQPLPKWYGSDIEV